MKPKKFTEQDKRRLMSRESIKHDGKIPSGSVALVAQRGVDKARHEATAKPERRRSDAKK
ncbi:hypothetical protein B0G84_7686 [Paraburkholderia sp. BL8N3]|nr:hypothetical protein [Paraburkholderia sp. BL8N3]TCK33461.1 hypothetical protein B0G84_7686 [Paraburkholderia sp. BL8N3]